MGAGPVSAAHNYRVSQGGPSIQLRAFKGQCNYYSVGISCVPRTCEHICLHRNIQISALFSVHAQLAAHVLSSYWYPEWTLGPFGDKGEKAKTVILKMLAQAFEGQKKAAFYGSVLGICSLWAVWADIVSTNQGMLNSCPLCCYEWSHTTFFKNTEKRERVFLLEEIGCLWKGTSL